MDGELVEPPSAQENSQTKKPTHKEKFEELFPYYLSIGMTYKQYWEEDCALVKAYRKAEELRKDRINSELWLQGLYIYDALIKVSPLLSAFGDKNSKPEPYVSTPYPLTEEQVKKAEREKEKEMLLKNKAKIEQFMIECNSARQQSEGGKDTHEHNR